MSFDVETQGGENITISPVSYTHLDVYKRQPVEEPVSKTLITTGDSYFKI